MQKEEALKLRLGTKCLVELQSKTTDRKYRMVGEFITNDLDELYSEDAIEAEFQSRGLTIEDAVAYCFKFNGKYGEFEAEASAQQIIGIAGGI